jgi:hypothetical protein
MIVEPLIVTVSWSLFVTFIVRLNEIGNFYYAKVVTFESFWRLLALQAVGARDIATEIWASAELPHWVNVNFPR